ncbi:MAG: ABC transporter ATP-binding protein [Polyangiales bacterium]
MSALLLRGVVKRYGKERGLDGLDLEVPRGSVFGLVGPNGAGKTTTFGIVSGALRADAGSVDILGGGGFDASKHAGRVSVLPQDCALNAHSSASQLLTFFARLQGMSAKEARKDAERVLDLVKLRERADARVGQLSHGMRRRLAVAQAFLGAPELVLLDEPTGGLDPALVVDMRELLKSQARKRTLIVSTHILADIESTCDHVAFLEAGRCVRSGPLKELTKHAGLVRIRLAAPTPLDSHASLLRGREARVVGDELHYVLHPDEDVAEVQARLIPALIEGGLRILEISLGESLEATYLRSKEP